MQNLSVLIVIDVDGALASGSVADNAYLVDTNGYLGSWQEGTDALHTICQDGQTITWSVAPVSPDGNVTIAGFSGNMVDTGVCRPALDPGSQPPAWSGRVEAQGQFAAFTYAVDLSLEGTQMSFNAFIKTV